METNVSENRNSSKAIVGRPSRYCPDYAEKARRRCLLGATEVDLARLFNVDLSSIHRWKVKYNEFRSALNAGREEADDEVAIGLYQKAKGYTITEKQPFKLKRIEYDESGKKIAEREEIVMVDVEKQIPTDPTSAIFWLKNRRPRDWRDKHHVEHSTDPAQLDAMIAKLSAQLPAIEHESDSQFANTDKPIVDAEYEDIPSEE